MKKPTEGQSERMREALKSLLSAAPIVECESFHHDKADRHTGVDCPVHKRWLLAISKAEEALR